MDEERKNGSVIVQCPLCKALLLLDDKNELIIAKMDDATKQKFEQQPFAIDFKEIFYKWREVYPLIRDEAEQIEREYNQVHHPVPDPSQQVVCIRCKHIISEEGHNVAYAKCGASAIFNCVTGKDETEHCYTMNGNGACQKYEPLEPIKDDEKK
jgi:hypothetical protein